MLGIFSKDEAKEFIGLKSRTYPDKPSSIDTALSFIPSSSHLSIADCCNGLLLLQDLNFKPLRLYICNPATRMWSQIPDPPPSLDCNLALSYDSSSHYKILFLNRIDPALSYLFRSETGEWRMFRPTTMQVAGHSLFAFLNGILYRVMVLSPLVMAIDLEWSLCNTIGSLLDVIPRIGRFRYHCIGHSRGLLHFAVTVAHYLYVVVLEGDRFVLKLETSLTAVADKFFASVGLPLPQDLKLTGLVQELKVVAFHGDLDLMFLRLKRTLIISYHLVSGEVEEVDEVGIFYYSPWVAYTPCYSKALDLQKNTTN